MPTEPLTCLLCGTTDCHVENTWVRFIEEVEGKQFGMIHRCRDRAACRRRVELAGGSWEVEDAA